MKHFFSRQNTFIFILALFAIALQTAIFNAINQSAPFWPSLWFQIDLTYGSVDRFLGLLTFEERMSYLKHYQWDAIYPWIYGLLLTCIWRRQSRSFWTWHPLLASSADIIENFCHFEVIAAYPDHSLWLARTGSFFAIVKWGLLSTSVAVLIAKALKDGKIWARGLRIIGLTSAVAVLLCLLYTQGKSSLNQQGNWISGKFLAEYTNMGNYPFANFRQSLAGDHLHLGVWYSNHEVIFNRLTGSGRFSAQLTLAPKSIVYVILEYSRSQTKAFRLSNNDKFPGAFHEWNENREFIKRRLLPSLNLNPGQWQVLVTTDSSTAKIFVNGKLAAIEEVALAPQRAVAFRNGFEPVNIDNFWIRSAGLKFFDNFSPQWSFSGLSLSLIVAIIFAVLSCRMAGEPTTSIILLNIACVLLILFIVDRGLWARRYTSKSSWLPIISDLEVWRNQPKGWNYPFNGDRVLTEIGFESTRFMDVSRTLQLIGPHPTFELSDDTPIFGIIDAKTILFMGTSQTWGQGALRRGSSFPELVIHSLIKAGFNVAGLNISVCGSRLQLLLDHLVKNFDKWSPDLVVANVSHNDGGNGQFPWALRRLIDLSRKKKFRLILVKEAVSRQLIPEPILNHQTMEKLADQYNVEIIDLAAHIAKLEAEDRGHLWQDVVHFDQYGHKEAAKLITDYLLKGI